MFQSHSEYLNSLLLDQTGSRIIVFMVKIHPLIGTLLETNSKKQQNKLKNSRVERIVSQAPSFQGGAASFRDDSLSMFSPMLYPVFIHPNLDFQANF